MSFIGNPPAMEEQSNSTATLAETIRWFLYVRKLTRPFGQRWTTFAWLANRSSRGLLADCYKREGW
jgi:hypothetical protein